MPPAGRRATAALAPLVLYAAAVCWLTWPLAAGLRTHLPCPWWTCQMDTPLMTWVLAHESRALVHAPSTFFEGNAFHPAPHAIGYGPSALGALPYFAPVFWLTGDPTLALNLVFLLGVTLTAWAVHTVVRIWTGSQLAGVVGAGTLLTSRWLIWGFPATAPHYTLVHYLPFVALLTSRPFRRIRDGLPLAGVVGAQALVDLVYVAPAALLPPALVGVTRFVRHATRRAGAALLAVLALATLLVLPAYLPNLAVRMENPSLPYQSFWTSRPAPIALPWGLVGGGAPMAVPLVAWLLIGAGATGVGLRSLRGTATPTEVVAWRHAFLWTAAGPLLVVMVTAAAPMMASLATARVPVRLAVAGLIGLSLLAGLAFAQCEHWVEGSIRGRAGATTATAALAALLVGAMYFDYRHGFGPPWLGRGPLPASYATRAAIASDGPIVGALREPGGPLLELPIGKKPRQEMAAHANAMYRSVFHWRPLLNGYNGYFPARFPERIALARRLPDAAALAALRAETGLDTVLVHLGRLPPPQRKAWLRASMPPGPFRVLARDGDELLLGVEEDPTAAR